MQHMICKNAICPYYLHEDSQVIYCMGMQDGVVLHVAFCNRAIAKNYKINHCRSGDYGKCMVAQMLAKKTDDFTLNRPP